MLVLLPPLQVQALRMTKLHLLVLLHGRLQLRRNAQRSTQRPLLYLLGCCWLRLLVVRLFNTCSSTEASRQVTTLTLYLLYCRCRCCCC